MFRIFSIIAGVFLIPHMASAEAVWANYSFNVKPGAEAKLEKAMRGYIEGNTEFTGKIFFNRQIMNGANSATHNVALLAPNMSEWEKGLARNQTDPNFSKYFWFGIQRDRISTLLVRDPDVTHSPREPVGTVLQPAVLL